MTAIVETGSNTHLGYWGAGKGTSRLVFRNPRGNKRYYAIYRDTITTDGVVCYEYSSDGITWSGSQVEILNNDFAGIWESFDAKIHDDGSQLEVWVIGMGLDTSTNQFTLRYAYGTISDSGSAISWNTQQTINANVNNEGLGPYSCAIARTDNDEMVVAFTEDYRDMGKNFRQTKLIGSDGSGAAPNWSGEIIWDDPSGNTNNQNKDEIWCGLESFSSSYGDRCLVGGRFPEGFGSTYYLVATAVPDWDQGGSGFTNTTKAELASGGQQPDEVAILIDDDDYSHILFARASEIRHADSNSPGDDVWGSTTIVSSDYIDALTITLDTGPTPNEIYVFYHHSADAQDFHYKVSPIDTISFGDEQTVSYHEEIYALSSWSRVVENSLHILAEAPVDTINYNEHPVYLALSTTLADLVFPDANFYLGPHST